MAEALCYFKLETRLPRPRRRKTGIAERAIRSFQADRGVVKRAVSGYRSRRYLFLLVAFLRLLYRQREHEQHESNDQKRNDRIDKVAVIDRHSTASLTAAGVSYGPAMSSPSSRVMKRSDSVESPKISPVGGMRMSLTNDLTITVNATPDT